MTCVLTSASTRFKPGALDLVDERAQRLGERHAGFEQRAELAREHGDGAAIGRLALFPVAHGSDGIEQRQERDAGGAGRALHGGLGAQRGLFGLGDEDSVALQVGAERAQIVRVFHAGHRLAAGIESFV